MRRPPHPFLARHRPLAVAGLVAALGAAGCSHPAPQVAAAPAPAPAPVRAHTVAWEDSVVLAHMAADRHRSDVARAAAESVSVHQMLYFSFNQALLTDADRQALDAKLGWLRAHPAFHLKVTGNCDDRGSDEYNLALGQSRAAAAKRYLVDNGIDPGRIDIISYGRERPVANGENAAAWALNRNDQFIVITGRTSSGT